MDAMSYLTGLALLLLIGIVATIVAKRLRISHILLLVLTGIFLVNLVPNSTFTFPPSFLVALSLLTLAMIVFDGSSRFTLHQLDKQSTRALELVILFIFFNTLLVGGALLLLFLKPDVQSMLLAVIFAVVMAGTDPGSVFILLGETKHKVLDFLRLEAVLNTPIVVIIPFLLLDVLRGVHQLTISSGFDALLMPLLQQVIVGIGAGLLLGIIVFRAMRKHYSRQLSPLVVIATTILAYVLAENLSGNGVVAVATLGILFGNSYVKRKGQLIEFSGILSTSLEILVFLFIGMLVTVNFTLAFLLKSLLLFLFSVLARFFATLFTLHHESFRWREKLFITLHAPKGIAVAVVTFAFAVLRPEMHELLTLMILFVVYSLLLGSVTDRYGKFFIRKEILETESVPQAKH